MSKILILDTETTGLIEPIQPVEMAWIELDKSFNEVSSFLKRYKPSKPIELGAKATSHIFEEELEDEEPWEQCLKDIPADTEYLIGQNIDYDWRVIGSPDIKRICTKALATLIWPDLDSYSQSALIYHLFGIKARPRLKNAHSALADVTNNKALLLEEIELLDKRYYLEPMSIEKLYELSELARVPTKITFGKFRGMPYTALDIGYVQWWMYKSDTPPDIYQMKAIRNAGFKV